MQKNQEDINHQWFKPCRLELYIVSVSIGSVETGSSSCESIAEIRYGNCCCLCQWYCSYASSHPFIWASPWESWVPARRTKLRERTRRSITTKIFHGLRKYGGYNLAPRADINEVLRCLASEAGWIVEDDGTTYRSSSQVSALPLISALSLISALRLPASCTKMTVYRMTVSHEYVWWIISNRLLLSCNLVSAAPSYVFKICISWYHACSDFCSVASIDLSAAKPALGFSP